jgi:deoxyadenosine/deoxycytidine kinase
MIAQEPLIAITGPIAAGKTTIGRLIANRLGFTFIEEEFDENLHLKTYHKGECDFFACQMWFMEHDLARYLRAVALSKTVGVVLDKPFFENLAYNNVAPLTPEQKLACNKIIMQWLQSRLIPHALIDITISLELMTERIAVRGRGFEQDISLPYIEALLLEREKQKQSLPPIPVVSINADTQDFLVESQHLEELVFQLKDVIAVDC